MLTGVFAANPSPMSRRRLLLGAVSVPVVLTVGACTDDSPIELPADPERTALSAARVDEQVVRAALATWPGSEREGDVTALEGLAIIDAHIAALDASLANATALAPSGSASASTSDHVVPLVSTERVIELLHDAVTAHTRALRSATAQISPLLASIAGSDAALAAAIDGGSQ